MANDVTSTGRPLLSLLWQPLSKVQAIVGITAGLITVSGFVFAKAGTMPPVPTHGELLAVIQEARSRKPVLDATIEVTTVRNALITTRISRDEGRVHQMLKEGQYRLRVRHPKFTPQVLLVQVTAGQTSELHLALTPRPPTHPPPKRPSEKPGPVKRFFRSLGF
jgi:hypothetical protein